MVIGILKLGIVVYHYFVLISSGQQLTNSIERRRICRYRTSQRRVALAARSIDAAQVTAVSHGAIEMDSHADTIVFGRNFTLLSYTGRECDVSPFSDTAFEAIPGVPVVSAATAWTCPRSCETFILVFNEGLWMPDQMESTLVNPNQLRHYGVTVQDNPFSASPMFIATEDGSFSLPLECEGTTILAKTRTPTQQELQECPHIVFVITAPLGSTEC